jgi:hypothetical protein
MVGIAAVCFAAACLGCRQSCRRKAGPPYTPGSARKNLLGKPRDSSSGDYAMVALDDGLSDTEDPAAVAAKDLAPIARVLDVEGDDDAAAAAATQPKEITPPISTDFLAEDGAVDDWLAAEPTKKEKIKVDYSSYG